MKISRKISEITFPTRQDVAQHIANAQGSDIADEDIADDETGEVFLHAGDRYDRSDMHPQFVRSSRKNSVLSDEEVDSLSLSDDLPQDNISSETAFTQLEDAVQEFILNFEDDDDFETESIPDAAEAFFVSYPNWREWSVATGMTQREIKDFVSDAIFDVLS